jgi:hypothetical protein
VPLKQLKLENEEHNKISRFWNSNFVNSKLRHKIQKKGNQRNRNAGDLQRNQNAL